jgi:hypothetical protein
MLTIAPPLYIINGVSVFRDSHDVLQYYFAPLEPRLALRKNEATGNDEPVISLIKFRDADVDDQGFLQLDVTLGLPEPQLKKISSALQSLADLDEAPRLSPIPLVDGDVQFLLLGEQTNEPSTAPVTPGTDSTTLVTALAHAGKPSLFGENRAIFSARLSTAGVAVVEAGMKGSLMPVGVVYSLQFLALRPAFKFTINADWSRVQNHLASTFGSGSLFHEVEISDVVDSLIHNQVIKIDKAVFVPPDEDNSATREHMEEMFDEVKTMVLESFFTPSLDPITEKPSDWQTAAEGLSSIRQVLHGGGAGGLFSYKRDEQIRIDERTLNAEVTSSSTVRRTIYPQAHLAGLSRVISSLGLTVDDFISEVQKDPWFTERNVTVLTLADFDGDDIERVHVRVKYGSEQSDEVLRTAGEQQTLAFNSIVEAGVVQRDVDVDYTVSFKSAAGSRRPPRLSSPTTSHDTNNVEIVPRELYTVTPIPIRVLPPDLFGEFPHIEVVLSADPAAAEIGDVIRLDAEHPTAIWKLFTAASAARTFEYKIIYHAANLSDVQLGWQSGDREEVVVRHPSPNQVPISIIPPGDMTDVQYLFVDVDYTNPDTAETSTQSAQFDANHRAAHDLKFDVAPGRPFLLTYRVTYLTSAGQLVELPPSMTRQRRIFALLQQAAHRVVEVRLGEGSFTQARLREIRVSLSYQGDASSFNRLFIFTSADAPSEYFEYDVAPGADAGYEVKVEHRLTNGMTRRLGPMEQDKDTVLVQIPT